MRLKQTYSAREVAAVTGLTARQLQAWDAGGLLAPAIRPHRTDAGGYTERRYSPIELFELLVLADLRRLGFSVQQLRTIVHALADQCGVSLFEATGGSDRVRLFTDGEGVYARTASGDLYNVLEFPAQPMLVIGDEELLQKLVGKVGRLTRRKRGRRRLSE